MLKKKIFLLLILFCCSRAYCQNINERNLELNYDFKVEFTHDYEHISLQQEGLLCLHTKYNIKHTKQKRKIIFIPLKKLVKEIENPWAIVDLFNYIDSANIMQITENKDTMNKKINMEHRSWITIRIFDVNTHNFFYLDYGYYDERIDKFLDLVGNIVPKKYKKRYGMKKEWIPR